MTKRKVSKRVVTATGNLLEFIGSLPKLKFTSGDITSFINGRVTYEKAWENIKRDGDVVKRVTQPRGKATTWKRTRRTVAAG